MTIMNLFTTHNQNSMHHIWNFFKEHFHKGKKRVRNLVTYIFVREKQAVIAAIVQNAERERICTDQRPPLKGKKKLISMVFY